MAIWEGYAARERVFHLHVSEGAFEGNGHGEGGGDVGSSYDCRGKHQFGDGALVWPHEAEAAVGGGEAAISTSGVGGCGGYGGAANVFPRCQRGRGHGYVAGADVDAAARGEFHALGRVSECHAAARIMHRELKRDYNYERMSQRASARQLSKGHGNPYRDCDGDPEVDFARYE